MPGPFSHVWPHDIGFVACSTFPHDIGFCYFDYSFTSPMSLAPSITSCPNKAWRSFDPRNKPYDHPKSIEKVGHAKPTLKDS